MLYFYGDKFYQERLDPLLEKEVEVIQGKRNESQLFHGRMARWQYAWKNFKDAPVTAWLFGYPTSLEDPFFNISIGIHNDYLRIFYFTGIIGILLYSFFFSIYGAGKNSFTLLKNFFYMVPWQYSFCIPFQPHPLFMLIFFIYFFQYLYIFLFPPQY